MTPRQMSIAIKKSYPVIFFGLAGTPSTSGSTARFGIARIISHAAGMATIYSGADPVSQKNHSPDTASGKYFRPK